MTSPTQPTKKPQFTSRPTELEQISRPHLEFTADSADDSTPHAEKTEFDLFADELDEEFEYPEFDDETTLHHIEPANEPFYKCFLPPWERALKFICTEPPKPSVFPSDITMLVDWSKYATNYGEIEIMEASQSIDIKTEQRFQARCQDQQPYNQQTEFMTGMFETEHTNQDLFDITVAPLEMIEWQTYNDHWMKFYHFAKHECYLFEQEFKEEELPRYRKAAGRGKTENIVNKLPQQTPEIKSFDVAPQIPRSPPTPEDPLKVSHLLDLAKQSNSLQEVVEQTENPKKQKAKKRVTKPHQPCTCTYTPFEDSAEQIVNFTNILQSVALFPLKMMFSLVLMVLFVSGWAFCHTLKTISNLFLFLISLWESRNFRFPILSLVMVLPLVCSLITLGIKTLLTINHIGEGQISGALDQARILNYNFFDPLEKNCMPLTLIGNTLLQEMRFATERNQRIEQISNFEEMKYLSSELNHRYRFFDTQSLVTYEKISEDITRLLLDDFRIEADVSREFTINDCASIQTTDVYLAVPCSFQGPMSPGVHGVNLVNLRNRLDIDNHTIYTISDIYGNTLRLVMHIDSQLYLRQHGQGEFSFSDMYIFSTSKQYIIEALYFDRGVERLGNIFYEDITEKYVPIKMLIRHDDQHEITLNITITAVKEDIPPDYVPFPPEYFEIFNMEMHNASFNFLTSIARFADNTSLQYNYQNLKHEMVDRSLAVTTTLVRQYSEILNWYLHYRFENDVDTRVLRKDGYRYYYLIYNVYFHYAIVLLALIFAGYCVIKMLFGKKSLSLEAAAFSLYVVAAFVAMYFGARYLLAFEFTSTLTEKLAVGLIIIQFAEGSLYYKSSLKCILSMLLIDHLQRMLDVNNRFETAVFYLCIIIFLHSLAQKHSVKHFIRSSFERNYFVSMIPFDIPFYDSIFLRVIDYPAASEDSLVVSIYYAFRRLISGFAQLFVVKRRTKHIKTPKKVGIKQLTPEIEQTNVKLSASLPLPSYNFVPTLHPDATAPWHIDALRLNQLNCQNETGYGGLETNLRIIENETTSLTKEKYLRLEVEPSALPSLERLNSLREKLPSHFPRLFSYTIDLLLENTIIELYMTPQEVLNIHPYSFKLSSFILPSKRHEASFLDISNITTNQEDVFFDEICFFATSFGVSYGEILSEITVVGKLFNYLAFPYLKTEKQFKSRQHHAQRCIGGIRQVAVQDAGYEASEREPPVYSIIPDDLIPRLTRTEIVFIIAALMGDNYGAGLLFGYHVSQSYFEEVASELHFIYREIVDEICNESASFSSPSIADICKLVELADNSPLFSPDFNRSGNIFGIPPFCAMLSDNFNAIVAYADSILLNPEEEHFSELSSALSLKPFFAPVDPHCPRLMQLICIAHHRLLEQRIVTFVGYCLDILSCSFLRENGYTFKSDALFYQFYQSNGNRDIILNDGCTSGCAEIFCNKFKAGQLFQFGQLCSDCLLQFERQIFNVLARYEDYAAIRFRSLQWGAMRRCRCEEDMMAILTNSGYMNGTFVRHVLRREASLLCEARVGGNQAQRSARACLVQSSGQKFSFNIRNVSEALYCVLICKSRSDLFRRIGLNGKWRESTELSQISMLLKICEGRRVEVVIDEEKSVIIDGIENDPENYPQIANWERQRQVLETAAGQRELSQTANNCIIKLKKQINLLSQLEEIIGELELEDARNSQVVRLLFHDQREMVVGIISDQ